MIVLHEAFLREENVKLGGNTNADHGLRPMWDEGLSLFYFIPVK